MRLTNEVCEAVIAGYLIGQNIPKMNGNGHIERSVHQRRRGRPRKSTYKAISELETAPVTRTIKKRKYTKKSDFWKS